MISEIHGLLVGISATSAIIDVQGIGFKVGMPTLSLAALGSLGSELMVYTTLIVREDALALYGFLDPTDRQLFEQLLSVSGVGPKVALSALSTFNAPVLQQLIVDEDVKRLSTIVGMGKKTVQRLILELKGNLVDLGNGEPGSASGGSGASVASAQAVEALLGIGFTSAEVELALKGYDGPADDIAAKVRFGLQRLGTK